MAPSLLGVDHIHVFVQDRQAAEAWYARVMGLSRSPGLEFWAADGGPLTLQDSANTVHIALFERPRQNNRATVALRTSAEGLRAWQAHLSAFPEITVKFEDHQVALSIYFSDPDGNPYEITTYDHEAFRAAR
ncbi:MAG TPA: VOC family protein [Rubrivivax sp.]